MKKTTKEATEELLNSVEHLAGMNVYPAQLKMLAIDHAVKLIAQGWPEQSVKQALDIFCSRVDFLRDNRELTYADPMLPN